MNNKFKALFSLIFFSSSASADQFESVIDAMSIKSSEMHSNNDWESSSLIKGVDWKWPYYESGAHDSTMTGVAKFGKDKNPNIGSTEIVINGSRSMMSSVEIKISNMEAGLEVLGHGNFKRISTSCDSDSPLNTVEFYSLERPGYKPLYVRYFTSWGAGGGGGVYFEVAYRIEDVLDLYESPCEAYPTKVESVGEKENLDDLQWKICSAYAAIFRAETLFSNIKYNEKLLMSELREYNSEQDKRNISDDDQAIVTMRIYDDVKRRFSSGEQRVEFVNQRSMDSCGKTNKLFH